MKIFSSYEPTERSLCAKAVKARGFDPGKYAHLEPPHEDFLLQSEKYTIFVVADGVTLEFDTDGVYPMPSPAGELAQRFCEAAIKEAEVRYDTFTAEDLLKVFRAGNQAAAQVNTKYGRTKEGSNFWDTDLLATTAAFALLKEDKMYWFSLCDARVSVFQGIEKTFSSWDDWKSFLEHLPKTWEKINKHMRHKIIRSVYRNAILKNGERVGYGVATGESDAEAYLESGVRTLLSDEACYVFTDGYEEYLKLPEVLRLFQEWPADMSARLQELSKGKIKEDENSFGHERSMFVVKVE